MKFNLFFLLMIIVSVSGSGQVKNYKIGDGGLHPSVVINLDNPKNIIVSPGNDQLYYSTDAGSTFKPADVRHTYDITGSTFLGATDNGEFYFVHHGDVITPGVNSTQLVAQTSKNAGKTWSIGSLITESPKTKVAFGAVVHPEKNLIGIAWSEEDAPASSDPTCKSQVYFAQSDDGKKWSDPQVLSQNPGDCTDNGTLLRDPSVAMDDEKKIFVTWSSQTDSFMDRSYDRGDTWLNNDMVGIKPTGDRLQTIPGVTNLVRRPVLFSDNSKCMYKNSLYLVWADQKNGPNDTDVWLAISSRRGDRWDPPIRINRDEKGKHQFMPAATIDQSSGVIYVVYYDRRNYDDNKTDVYLSWSTDGGNKFTDKKISDEPFTPVDGGLFPENISIAASAGIIVPVWVRIDDGKPSVWTTVIKQTEIIEKIDLPRATVVQRKNVQNLRRPVQQGAYQSQMRRRGQY